MVDSCPPELSSVLALIKSNTPPMYLPLEASTIRSSLNLHRNGLKHAYIVYVRIDVKYWHLTNDWNYTINRFLARALGLDKREVLCFRFNPNRGGRTKEFFVAKQLWQAWQPGLAEVYTLPGIELNPLADVMPFFVSDSIDTRLSFLLTDYLFFECSKPNQYEQAEFQIRIQSKSKTILSDYQLPDRIYGKDAIPLEHLKHDHGLVAIPWKRQGKPSSPEKVRSYIAKVFRWCLRRMKNKPTLRPFPSSLLIFQRTEQAYLGVDQWCDIEQAFLQPDEYLWYLAGQFRIWEECNPTDFFFPQ